MSNENETAEAPEVADVTVKRARKARSAGPEGLFPIKLLKSYRPFGTDPDGWGDFMIERHGELQEPGINDEGYVDRDKVNAGVVIHVPRDEARRAISLGIAERNDPV